ncbi:MAG: aminotransferase class V-fold PLP-dependent enzyme, partial [Thermoplasmata archaeon]|nr:aminotransferase class V-fold PLP-dependent enzyme [Thermoplasmata archaeon]
MTSPWRPIRSLPFEDIYKEDDGGMEMGEKRIYMDYGASCPVDQRIVEAVSKATKEFVGNPSSLHTAGRNAKKALEDARGKVAA